MKISAIIPTYQGADYIRETLRSIVAQSRPPDEIVISDNQSPDGTAEIAAEFASDSTSRCKIPVRIFDKQADGISNNYFNALHHSTGDLIIVGDQDDVWVNNKVETICAEFSCDRALCIVSSDSEVVSEELKPAGNTLRGGRRVSLNVSAETDKNDLLSFLKGLRLDAHTLAFRSSVKNTLSQSAFIDIPAFWFEEQVAMAAISAGRLKLVPDCLTLYRQHPSQHVGFTSSAASEHAYSEHELKLMKLQAFLQLMKTVSNSGNSLLSPVEANIRITLLQDYIEFQRLRHGCQGYESGETSAAGKSRFIKLLSRLLDGSYRKYSRSGLLAFGKDVLL